MKQTWEETALWKEIQSRSSPHSDRNDEIVGRMRLYMTDAEAILARGETAPADFTLHDEMHGYRVAQRMGELIGVSRLREFSTTELALLLSSAYLHDIGMTPGRGQVSRHRRYLINAEQGLLSDAEKEDLQTWLDDHADGLTPPLATGIPDSAALAQVDELLTYYCRSRHNDWSSDWIREHIATADRELYLGFSDDLILLCRSHHEGYDELIGSRFDAKIVGSDIVHPRYLAALLRVADILEFDPERTPEIVFRHRDVAPSSTLYWHKDHEVTFRSEGHYFIFYARPRDAATFQALRQMADEIDVELGLCIRLEKEGRFQLAPLRTGNDPRYLWKIDPILKRDLHPKPGAFEEFEGAFQPNPRRLLSILAGTQLYDTHMAAVRELLQNAFDAVREQIAYERLAEIERFGAADPSRIAARHLVTLRINRNDDRWELVCTDTGVGMTREILRRRFLSSGSTRGHREMALERRSKAHGFTVGRTGEFGIGALSYFMIADRLDLATKRSSEPGDFDDAWQFRVSGVNDFGELRRAALSSPGTTVSLRLKPTVVGNDIAAFVADLKRYLDYVLARVPCRFVCVDQASEVLLKFEPGWTKTPRDLAAEQYPSLHPTRRWLEPPELKLDSPFPHAEDVWHRLRWDCDEGNLPNDLGIYRIVRFWFNLDGGAARSWFDARPAHGTIEIYATCLPENSHPARISWNGMTFRDQSTIFIQAATAVEIDLSSVTAGRLAVNRNSFQYSSSFEAATDWLRAHVHELDARWLREHESSIFWAHALRLTDTDPSIRAIAHWPFRTESDNAYVMRVITFPAVTNVTRSIRIGGSEIEPLRDYPDSVSWENRLIRPTRMLSNRNDRRHVALIWDDDRNAQPFVQLPPAWRDIAFIDTDIDELCNSNHPLILALPREDVAAALGREPPPTNNAALRVIDLCTHVSMAEWDETAGGEWTTLWDRMNSNLTTPLSRLIGWDVGSFGQTLTIWNREGVEEFTLSELTAYELREFLPAPGIEWEFEVV